MFAILNNPTFGAYRPPEQLFLESWLNLAHPRSLDTYRVRCHNGRTILSELTREMALKLASVEDLAHIATEGNQLCKADPILQKIFGASFIILTELLGELSKRADSKETLMASKPWTRYGYLWEDFETEMGLKYIDLGFQLLSEAIAASDLERVVSLTSLILTDLVDRGWALGSLQMLINRFLVANANFTNCYAELVARVKHAEDVHDVTLSISGTPELQNLGDFCGFQFSANPPAVPQGVAPMPVLQRFLRTNPHRAFATTHVTALDLQSAAHAALEKFELCQDRLRFNLSPVPVGITDHVWVLRQSDQKNGLIKLLFGIPNPPHRVPLNVFLVTSRKLDALKADHQVDPASVTRIQSAARHYRMGRDGKGFNNMLLSWWTGLETLMSQGEGKGIGLRVFSNAVPIVCHRYFEHQLQHLGRGVKDVVKTWPQPVTALLTVAADADLSAEQILRTLHNPAAFAAVSAALAGHPWLEHHWSRFQKLASQGADLRDYLKAHAERVKWHLMRLYRIRCCLVHGTPVVTRLQLPAANLEYYLREAIYVVTTVLDRSPRLGSVETIFSRAAYAVERRDILLSVRNAGPDAVHAALRVEFTFA